MDKARIGLIGTGWIGSEHARNLGAHPDAELVAIANTNRGKAQVLAKQYAPEAAIETDYRELLKRDDVDGVFICTPNALHAEMTIAAAEAGKHIMCEKPMAITLDDCRRVREAVRKAGVQYLIGYHRRFNPLYTTVKELLDSGKLGEPVFIESDYVHHIPAELDIWDWLGKESIAGSLFHGGAGHCIDLIRFFCGEITEVTCLKDIRFPRKIQIETEDVAVATMRFANGAMGKVMLLLGGINPFKFDFSLYGTGGTVLNNRLWLNSIPRFDQPGFENDCIELPHSWIPDNVQGGVAETWDKLDDHFVAMLTRGAESINDVESAWRTSRAVFAILEAGARQEVVKLDQSGE
jgi:predicted dehydrogenase